MSEHKLRAGIDFIKGLEILGEILGYVTESEFPVIETDIDGIAIDVAWFLEEGQKFPLFIFEVESTASNSMVYNPLKVLGKPNEVFEKPLFYFQIVLSQGQNSSRVEDLKRAYGIYNYRIYRLSLFEEMQLITDVLSQHRRLSAKLDIVALVDFIKRSQWVDLNIANLIIQIRALDFEIKSGEFLQAIGILSLKYLDIVPVFCSELEKIYGASIDYDYHTNYQTYIGAHFSVPIHLGIRAFNANSTLEKGYCLQKLMTWQDNGNHLTMVGPHFGLSQDYDQFLIYLSGGYFALLACLFSDLEGSLVYFCSELEKIIDATAPDYRAFNYIWLILIAPKNTNGQSYIDRATAFFMEEEYFSSQIAGNLPFMTNDDLLHDFQNSFEKFDIKAIIREPTSEINKESLTQTAIATLVHPALNEEISKDITSYLLNL